MVQRINNPSGFRIHGERNSKQRKEWNRPLDLGFQVESGIPLQHKTFQTIKYETKQIHIGQSLFPCITWNKRGAEEVLLGPMKPSGLPLPC